MARLWYYALPNNTTKISRALLYKNDENWSTGILNYNFNAKYRGKKKQMQKKTPNCYSHSS